MTYALIILLVNESWYKIENFRSSLIDAYVFETNLLFEYRITSSIGHYSYGANMTSTCKITSKIQGH
jgi:hypothetical protein